MTNDKITIRRKLFIWFMAFSAASLIVLWLMQTVFFDDVYGFYKKQVMKSQAEVIVENINNAEINSLIASISQDNNLSIYIINQSGLIKYVSQRSTTVRINKVSKNIFSYWALAAGSNGIYEGEVDGPSLVGEDGEIFEYNPNHFTGDVPKKSGNMNIVYARLCTSSSGETSMVLLIANREPIKSLTGVINFTIIITTIFMVIVCFVGALVVSKTISKPIEQLSDSAEHLATGDYNTVFHGGGCREITCLSKSLNRMTSELSKVEKLRREFFANVSHDLRTPLTMISGYGKMMQELPGEDNAENLQIIVDEADRLTKLVNGILDLSKLQSGSYDLRPSIFSLTDAAAELVSELEKLYSGKAELSFSSSREVFISADETLVSEAMYNLIINAITHSGNGAKIEIIQTTENRRVRITVKDNGPGIAEADLSGIWDRYRKGSGSGTGLGLAIVKAVTELNHGTYGVSSEVGVGSEFWVEFPEE